MVGWIGALTTNASTSRPLSLVPLSLESPCSLLAKLLGGGTLAVPAASVAIVVSVFDRDSPVLLQLTITLKLLEAGLDRVKALCSSDFEVCEGGFKGLLSLVDLNDCVGLIVCFLLSDFVRGNEKVAIVVTFLRPAKGDLSGADLLSQQEVAILCGLC